jgi:hypothetical protein
MEAPFSRAACSREIAGLLAFFILQIAVVDLSRQRGEMLIFVVWMALNLLQDSLEINTRQTDGCQTHYADPFFPTVRVDFVLLDHFASGGSGH